ncbi:MAG: hypothetical protein F9K18_14905, partial [Thermoanaerobaculia bacterium]
ERVGGGVAVRQRKAHARARAPRGLGQRVLHQQRADAAALLARDLRPIDDLRSTAAYRALVAGRLLESLLGDLSGYAPGLA